MKQFPRGSNFYRAVAEPLELGPDLALETQASVLSHLNNSMDYSTLVDELPDWAAPGHDGLEISL